MAVGIGLEELEELPLLGWQQGDACVDPFQTPGGSAAQKDATVDHRDHGVGGNARQHQATCVVVRATEDQIGIPTAKNMKLCGYSRV